MAILATQTLVGNVGKVYDLRTVGKDNKSVLDFSMAITPRKRTADGEWTDGETYWINVTVWGKLADNVAASFNSGDRVFVHGRTEMKPGYPHKPSGDEMPARAIVIADFAGLEVSSHPAESKRDRNGGGNRGYEAAKPAAREAAPAAAPAAKPAATEKDIFEDDFLDDDDPPF